MEVNDNAGNLMPRGVWAIIASKLAPTVSSLDITRRLNHHFD